jgi:hypothetical protein
VTEKPRLYDLFPSEARSLLEVRGKDLVEKLGEETVRQIVADVLAGGNIRNATEALTRRRIAHLNAALLVLFLRGRMEDENFPRNLPSRVREELKTKGLSSSEKRVLWWLLGLTKKQIDNVLRSDANAWDEYEDLYASDLRDVGEAASSAYGELPGTVGAEKVSDPVTVDWEWALHLLQTVGTQERATRGSEKSMYGKFFEKLVLGGVLHVLGFRVVEEDDTNDSDRVFWLSSRGRKRESDATALLGPGQGVRFDIGFIGGGNPEITLDKTSRFEREAEINGESIYMGTIVIVDTIGVNSRIPRLAAEAEASVVQMSASYWPRDLGDELAKIFADYTSPFEGLDDDATGELIKARMETAPFHDILGTVAKAEEPDA